MTIGRDEVLRIARLAHLEIDPDDESLLQSLRTILEYVSMLDDLDVSGVEPTRFHEPGGARLREDEPRPGLTAEEALANAPEARENRFRVPGVPEP